MSEIIASKESLDFVTTKQQIYGQFFPHLISRSVMTWYPSKIIVKVISEYTAWDFSIQYH